MDKITVVLDQIEQMLAAHNFVVRGGGGKPPLTYQENLAIAYAIIHGVQGKPQAVISHQLNLLHVACAVVNALILLKELAVAPAPAPAPAVNPPAPETETNPEEL